MGIHIVTVLYCTRTLLDHIDDNTSVLTLSTQYIQ